MTIYLHGLAFLNDPHLYKSTAFAEPRRCAGSGASSSGGVKSEKIQVRSRPSPVGG
jgi:hypothetical protein